MLDKHIDSCSEGAPSHYLRLAPWGPVPGREDEVDRELYQAVEVGGTVCVVLRSGRSAPAGSTFKPATDRGLNGRGKLGVAAPSLRKPVLRTDAAGTPGTDGLRHEEGASIRFFRSPDGLTHGRRATGQVYAAGGVDWACAERT